MKKLTVLLIILVMSSQLIFGNLTLDKELDRLSFDKNAQKSSKAAFKVGISSFIFQVPYEENEKKALEVEYKNGKRERTAKFYYFNGELFAKGKYKEDKKDGTWEFYFEDGKLNTVSNYF